MIDISNSLEGYLLVSISDNQNDIFYKSVVLICQHDINGVMGIIINHPLDNLELCDVIQQINGISIEIMEDFKNNPQVYWGGPMEINRGFVIHSLDYVDDKNTIVFGRSYGMTSTINILKEIFSARGPEKYLIALGYINWEIEELESEIENNLWLLTKASKKIIFDKNYDEKRKKALTKIGIKENRIIIKHGNA